MHRKYRKTNTQKVRFVFKFAHPLHTKILNPLGNIDHSVEGIRFLAAAAAAAAQLSTCVNVALVLKRKRGGT